MQAARLQSRAGPAAAPARFVYGMMAAEAIIEGELGHEPRGLGQIALQQREVALRVLELPGKPQVHFAYLALAPDIAGVPRMKVCRLVGTVGVELEGQPRMAGTHDGVRGELVARAQVTRQTALGAAQRLFGR